MRDLALDAQQVNDEYEVLAREPVTAAGRSVRLLRRDGQLTSSADLHTRDSFLPALDQPAQRELDRLAPIPGRVELLAVVELDADVVHLDRVARVRLGALAHDDVFDREVSGGL